MPCTVLYTQKPKARITGRPIETDTLKYQQTEKIETEVKDVDRIRAHRCTQHCPEEVCIDPFIIC